MPVDICTHETSEVALRRTISGLAHDPIDDPTGPTYGAEDLFGGSGISMLKSPSASTRWTSVLSLVVREVTEA